jgi:hypothetical protein
MNSFCRATAATMSGRLARSRRVASRLSRRSNSALRARSSICAGVEMRGRWVGLKPFHDASSSRTTMSPSFECATTRSRSPGATTGMVPMARSCDISEESGDGLGIAAQAFASRRVSVVSNTGASFATVLSRVIVPSSSRSRMVSPRAANRACEARSAESSAAPMVRRSWSPDTSALSRAVQFQEVFIAASPNTSLSIRRSRNFRADGGVRESGR